MSKTPRTDTHYATTKTAWPTQADIDFARELERENAALRAAITKTLEANLHLADGDVCTLKRLKDALK
jgi:hypothetical protein